MTQTNPFSEPQFRNIPALAAVPDGEPPVDEQTESEESSPFPDPPVDDDTKTSTGGGQ